MTWGISLKKRMKIKDCALSLLQSPLCTPRTVAHLLGLISSATLEDSESTSLGFTKSSNIIIKRKREMGPSIYSSIKSQRELKLVGTTSRKVIRLPNPLGTSLNRDRVGRIPTRMGSEMWGFLNRRSVDKSRQDKSSSYKFLRALRRLPRSTMLLQRNKREVNTHQDGQQVSCIIHKQIRRDSLSSIKLSSSSDLGLDPSERLLASRRVPTRKTKSIGGLGVSSHSRFG